MKLTLGKKLFLYTSSTLVVLLLITFLVFERSQSRQWEEYLHSQSLSFARFATPELLKLFRGTFPPQQQGDLQNVFDFLGFNRDLVRFSLYSPGGRRLYASPRFPDFIDLDLGPAEAEPAEVRLLAADVTARTVTLSGGGRILDLLAPAFGPTGEQVLAVRYLVSYDSVDIRLAEVRLHFLRITLVTVLCTLVLVALVARRVTRPIQALTEGARAIARDELQTRIASRSGDEIGALATAFNEMAESLAASRSALTEKHEALLRTNEELRQVQEQLLRSERLAAIGQLAAGVSHEIDNPVGIILGYAELLLEDLEEGDSRREDVCAIIDECRRCKRITGGLLGFARSAPAHRAPLDLGGLVEGTVASLRPQKLFKEVTFRIRNVGPALRVVADADQIRQVLVNLLLNAAQAMAGRGTLTVEVRGSGRGVEVRVIDSGPGIVDELHERIFEPFFSTKGRGEGTGLGLSLCRKLVEGHGGTLTVEPVSGGGACFCMVLPKGEKCFDKGTGDSLG